MAIVSDFWLMDEGLAKGHVFVYDMDGYVLGHMTRMRLGLMKKYMNYVQVQRSSSVFIQKSN